MMRSVLMLVLVASLNWLGVSHAVLAAEGTLSPAPGTAGIKTLCDKVRPAYIFISGGSGVVIRPDGLMLTNSHVIENQKEFDVRTGEGKHYRARVVGTDKLGDLAALKLDLKPDQQVPYLELGDSEALQVGDFALAIGNPFGLGMVDQSPTFTFGIISSLHVMQGTYTQCILTDAEVNPGNSGGPLVNAQGQVVGINGQISTRWGLRSNTGMGYAISARQVKLWLPKLETAQGRNVEHGQLTGLTVRMEPAKINSPLTVEDVAEETAGATAGFQKGDVFLRMDGYPIPNFIQLRNSLGVYPAGTTVTVDVRRGDQEVPLKVDLVARRPGRLGLKLGVTEGDDKQVVIKEVEANAAAGKAGLLAGDQFQTINDRVLNLPPAEQIKALETFMSRELSAGDIVKLKVRRKNEAGEFSEVVVRMVAR
ncbi:MAG: S1C family serine protease [Planctomycetota bacterium]